MHRTKPKTYMAASVPRFLRQTKLSHLPLSCVLGSRHIRDNSGSNFIFDIVMLPVMEFQRMKTTVGSQHVMAPQLKPGGTAFQPSFVLADIKQITVAADEKNHEAVAREYFMLEFGLTDPQEPQKSSPYKHAAKACTKTSKIKITQ